jgi:CRISPR system Cascade subunit CasA
MDKCVITPSFDLRDERWIRVTYLDGRSKEVSIRQIFQDSAEIAEISGDIPQQELPILRLLLAILRRSFGNPDLSDSARRSWWIGTWEAGCFDCDRLNGYLDRFGCEFNLFGPHPFYQTADLAYQSGKVDPIAEAIADVPKEDSFLFSMRGKGDTRPLGFAEAARWLVFLQAYDIAGIKTPVNGNTHVKSGKVYPPSGVPSTGWLGSICGVFVEGDNLFQTLMWNLDVFDKTADLELFGNPDDLPAWERAQAVSDYLVRKPDGPADLETLQTRRIRLVATDDDTAVSGVIMCYGDLVHPVWAHEAERMTAWRESPEQQKKLGTPDVPLMPVRLDGSKEIWRGLSSLLAMSDKAADLRPGVVVWMDRMRTTVGWRGKFPQSVVIHVQGMEYGTQAAVYSNGVDDSMRIGSAMACDDVRAVAEAVSFVDRIDRAVYELSLFEARIKQISGSKNASPKTSTDIRESAYQSIDPLFREYLAGFTEDVDPAEYTMEWMQKARNMILGLGSSLVRESEALEFGSHITDEKAAIRFLPQAQRAFSRNVRQVFSGESLKGSQDGKGR